MAGKELEEKRRKLIELLGLYFERQKMVPPVGSRILATLILNGNRGTTFDELVHDLEASKATVSTSINTLLAQKRVVYFTKPGDRKRYHCMAPGFISRKIGTLLDHWRLEAELHQQVLEYKNAVNETGTEEQISTFVAQDALEFLAESIAFFGPLQEKYRTREEQYSLHKL